MYSCNHFLLMYSITLKKSFFHYNLTCFLIDAMLKDFKIIISNY